MKKNIIISIIAILGFLSCKQPSKTTPDLVDAKKEETVSYEKSIDTEYKYTESIPLQT